MVGMPECARELHASSGMAPPHRHRWDEELPTAGSGCRGQGWAVPTPWFWLCLCHGAGCAHAMELTLSVPCDQLCPCHGSDVEPGSSGGGSVANSVCGHHCCAQQLPACSPAGQAGASWQNLVCGHCPDRVWWKLGWHCTGLTEPWCPCTVGTGPGASTGSLPQWDAQCPSSSCPRCHSVWLPLIALCCASGVAKPSWP